MLPAKFSLQAEESPDESFNDVNSSESEIDSRGRFITNDLERGLGRSLLFFLGESNEEGLDVDGIGWL